MVPVTNTRSPGLAPARRTMVPSGTLPNIAIEIVTGPRRAVGVAAEQRAAEQHGVAAQAFGETG